MCNISDLWNATINSWKKTSENFANPSLCLSNNLHNIQQQLLKPDIQTSEDALAVPRSIEKWQTLVHADIHVIDIMAWTQFHISFALPHSHRQWLIVFVIPSKHRLHLFSEWASGTFGNCLLFVARARSKICEARQIIFCSICSSQISFQIIWGPTSWSQCALLCCQCPASVIIQGKKEILRPFFHLNYSNSAIVSVLLATNVSSRRCWASRRGRTTKIVCLDFENYHQYLQRQIKISLWRLLRICTFQVFTKVFYRVGK